MILALAFAAALCAAAPAILFVLNLRLYRQPKAPTSGLPLPVVSILIPARNEAAGIEAAVRSALHSTGCAVEVIVMDDSSSDDTAAIVRGIAAEDPRVRLELAPALPPGWNGKQHACWALAAAAHHSLLCFVDADVRLEPSCVARTAAFLEAGGNSLVSGFPRQVTGTILEWLLLPLIHFVLLGFLPLSRMRAGTDPAFAAGCGQFMLVQRDAYFACGGHSGIRLTMHDGLRLPRLFREHGLRTDLADLTSLAQCRMYTSARQVWNGLAKNATEGLADPRRILPVTLILLLGQVLPFLFLTFAAAGFFYGLKQILREGLNFHVNPQFPFVLAFMLVSVIAAWTPRWLAVVRFRQDWRSALLHPFGILLLLAIQWYALVRKLIHAPIGWRDRTYVPEP